MGSRAIAGLLILGCMVAGCGRKAERTPGALTSSEQQQLNEAAVMLDANSVQAGSVMENDSE
jgi:hypothetical protein